MERSEDQTPLEYLQYFKRVVKANNWTDRQAGEVFAAMLGVRDTTLNGLDGQWNGLEDLEVFLKQNEQPMREANLENLMLIRIKEGEKIMDFRNRCAHLTSLVYGNLDQEGQAQITRDHFLFGLPREFRKQILTGRPKTLEEVVSVAAAAYTSYLTSEEKHVEVSVASRQDGRDGTSSYKRQKDGRHRLFTCWRCGKKGHIERFCHQSSVDLSVPSESDLKNE
jgi:hypothetical protein